MSVASPVQTENVRDRIIQEYRKKVQEHQEYESRLKQGMFLIVVS